MPRASFCPGTALTVAVRGLLDAVDYTAVITTYAWTAPIFEPLARRALRILDVQDIISQHGERSEKATGERSEFWMPLDTEQFLWRKWDVLLAITDEEARDIAGALRPAQHLLTVGHAVPMPAPTAPSSNTLVYAASDNPSNRQAVEWLLTEVWPRVLKVRPDATLRLVGLICKAIENLPIGASPNVTLAGFVDDPAPEVAAASIVVAPYLYGSGLKVKVLEAAGARRPVITTSSGVEGTGMRSGEHLIVADDPAQFADAIVSLLGDGEMRSRLADAAREHVEKVFSAKACYQALVDIIQNRAEESVKPGLIPSSVEARIGEVVKVLDYAPLVIWGNGSHTRALLHVLARLNAPVRCIVDRGATAEGVSAEGVPVIPVAAFVATASDVVLLSSQTFEPQMWQDVAAVRGEAQAMALYRRELITPELKRRLPGATPLRPVAASPKGAAQSRVVIVEPSAGKSGGHFYRPARALQAAAAQRSMSVILAGSRRVSLDGLSHEDRLLLEPAFESAFWDVLPATSDESWPAITRSARLFAHELQRLGDRLVLREDDVVVLAMANLVEVLGAAHWLASGTARSLPALRLLFHFLPQQEAQWLKMPEMELRHAYNFALALLDERAGGRMHILAQSGALATRIGEILSRRVDAIGYPLQTQPRPAAVSRRGPYRLLFAGEARSDKGFALLPALADAFSEELQAGQIQLVCQAKLNAFADEGLKRTVRHLSTRSGIEIIESYLPTEAYEALIAGCDLVALPYDPDQYRARLSAVFVDATCAGVPVAVPSETWMSAQLDLHLGAGERFSTVDAASVADAVRRAMTSRDAIERAASQAAVRARAQHDPGAVLDGILAGARVAA
jgi:glycosyltransferase involved in cell wall biosynthesis